MHRVTTNDLEEYTGQRCAICVLIVSSGPKFKSVSLYTQLFTSYGSFWDKCTEWPPELIGTIQGQMCHLHVLFIPLRSQISLRFALRPALFPIHGWKSQMHRITLHWPWTLNLPWYTKYFPWGPNCGHFHLRPAIFEIQCSRKSEMHWITSD